MRVKKCHKQIYIPYVILVLIFDWCIAYYEPLRSTLHITQITETTKLVICLFQVVIYVLLENLYEGNVDE